MFTGTHAGGAIFGLTQPDEALGGSEVKIGVVVADFAFAALHLASAAYGYSKVSSCREAQARWHELARAETGGQAPPPGRGNPSANAAGFELGKSISDAQARCGGGSLVWVKHDETRFSCGGVPSDLGVALTMNLTTCAGLVCEVAAHASADGADWSVLVERYDKLVRLLSMSHGPHQTATVPVDCPSEVTGCFEAGRAPDRQLESAEQAGSQHHCRPRRRPAGRRAVVVGRLSSCGVCAPAEMKSCRSSSNHHVQS